MADGVAAPVGEEHLVGHRHSQAAGGGAQQAGAMAPGHVAGDGGEVGEVLDERPTGNHLPERHRVDLVVAGHDSARGVPGQGGVAEVVGAGVLDDAGHDGGVEAAGHGGHRLGLGRALDPVDVDHVLGPDHQVDGRGDGVAGPQLAEEHALGVAVQGPHPALAPALHGRHPERAGVVGSGHQHPDGHDDGHRRQPEA